MMLWTIKLLPFQDTLTQHIFLICQRQCVKSFNTFQLRALKMRLRLCALYVLERLVCALCKCAWAVVKATYGGGWLVYGPDLLLNQISPDTPNFPTFLDFQPFSSSKTHKLTYMHITHSKFPSTTLFLPLMIWSKIRPLSFRPGRVLPDQSAASARPILMRLVGRGRVQHQHQRPARRRSVVRTTDRPADRPGSLEQIIP